MTGLATKTSAVLPQTIGVREFTRDFSRVSKQLKRTKRPLFVMSRNRPELIALGLEAYREFTQWLEDRHDAALLARLVAEDKNAKTYSIEEARKIVENAV